jgi:hypothetical protein
MRAHLIENELPKEVPPSQKVEEQVLHEL